ncbi:MAG: type II toxin-antitoxin system Phd/YefM family antitoxin [Candidatus Omnitrophota bacterium]
MVNIINLKKLRPQLPSVIENIDTKLDRYIVMKRDKPVAVMISLDDYEGLLETVGILSDRKLVKKIKEAKREIKGDKIIYLKNLLRKIEKPNA